MLKSRETYANSCFFTECFTVIEITMGKTGCTTSFGLFMFNFNLIRDEEC